MPLCATYDDNQRSNEARQWKSAVKIDGYRERESTGESGCFSSMAADGDSVDARFAGVDASSGRTKDRSETLDKD